MRLLNIRRLSFYLATVYSLVPFFISYVHSRDSHWNAPVAFIHPILFLVSHLNSLRRWRPFNHTYLHHLRHRSFPFVPKKVSLFLSRAHSSLVWASQFTIPGTYTSYKSSTAWARTSIVFIVILVSFTSLSPEIPFSSFKAYLLEGHSCVA